MSGDSDKLLEVLQVVDFWNQTKDEGLLPLLPSPSESSANVTKEESIDQILEFLLEGIDDEDKVDEGDADNNNMMMSNNQDEPSKMSHLTEQEMTHNVHTSPGPETCTGEPRPSSLQTVPTPMKEAHVQPQPLAAIQAAAVDTTKHGRVEGSVDGTLGTPLSEVDDGYRSQESQSSASPRSLSPSSLSPRPSSTHSSSSSTLYIDETEQSPQPEPQPPSSLSPRPSSTHSSSSSSSSTLYIDETEQSPQPEPQPGPSSGKQLDGTESGPSSGKQLDGTESGPQPGPSSGKQLDGTESGPQPGPSSGKQLDGTESVPQPGPSSGKQLDVTESGPQPGPSSGKQLVGTESGPQPGPSSGKLLSQLLGAESGPQPGPYTGKILQDRSRSSRPHPYIAPSPALAPGPAPSPGLAPSPALAPGPALVTSGVPLQVGYTFMPYVNYTFIPYQGQGVPIGASVGAAPMMGQVNLGHNNGNNIGRAIKAGMTPATCPLCGMKAASSGHIRRHLQSHGSGRKYKCKYCTCAYGRYDCLQSHVKNVHPSQ
ncbi:hypothetical protein Pcinc_012632 [Petrolisthes cinctipes]|uniref:C2H2-type domain-containing protein n=1 Tax=Petrolisthes cinctipes TaxID=88211 RepID=A0AAE1G0K2_PETCI|nr:hypothetical protein Pcinc_012632 [Petrolisthes cinctipes]